MPTKKKLKPDVFVLKIAGLSVDEIASQAGLPAKAVNGKLWRAIHGGKPPKKIKTCAVCGKAGRIVCSNCQNKGRRNGWCMDCKIPKGSVVGLGPVCMRCR